MRRRAGDLLRNATPGLEELDSQIHRSWLRVLKASSTSDIDKQMDLVDKLLDRRLLLMERRGALTEREARRWG